MLALVLAWVIETRTWLGAPAKPMRSRPAGRDGDSDAAGTVTIRYSPPQCPPSSRPRRRIPLIAVVAGRHHSCLPVLRQAREAYPQAHIAWLVSTGFAPLLDGHPLLNEVIPFDRRRFGRMLQSPRVLLDFLAFVRGVRRRRFDLVIDLQGLVRSGFLAWASGARRRIGFADARELAWIFYTRHVRVPPTMLHAVEKNLAVLAPLGLNEAAPRFPVALRPEERQSAQAKLAEAAGGSVPARFVAVLPGARWESKLWPASLGGTLDARTPMAGRRRCCSAGR